MLSGVSLPSDLPPLLSLNPDPKFPPLAPLGNWLDGLLREPCPPTLSLPDCLDQPWGHVCEVTFHPWT